MEDTDKSNRCSSVSGTIAMCMHDKKKHGDTAVCYSRHITRLSHWLRAGGKSLLEATHADLRGYLAQPCLPKSNATYNVTCSAFRCFFGWAYGKGMMEEDPSLGFRTKSRPPRQTPNWTTIEEEVTKVVESIEEDSALGRRDRVMVELMLELGLNCNGVAMLRIDQFSRDGFVVLRQSPSMLVEYKLPDSLAKRVVDYIDNDQVEFVMRDEDRWILFPSRWGGTLLRQSMWKMIVKRAREAGVTISPKKIRQAALSRLLGNGTTASEAARRISLSPDRVRTVMAEILRSREIPNNDTESLSAAL